jgi:hypothetical protein
LEHNTFSAADFESLSRQPIARRARRTMAPG